MEEFFQIDWSEHIPILLGGLRQTLIFTAGGFTLATALALTLALMRVSRVRLLRVVAALYMPRTSRRSSARRSSACTAGSGRPPRRWGWAGWPPYAR